MTVREWRPGTPRIVTYLARPGANPGGHEVQTQRALARDIADLLGWPFCDDWDDTACLHPNPYYVPGETLDAAQAEVLGARGAEDLFGGVVPAAFVATKSIAHPLVEPDACAPIGWSAAFPDQVRGLTLPGYAAFTAADARLAGERMLRQGSVRVKLATGVGGLGQSVVRNDSDLAILLDELEAASVFESGVVLERNLERIATYSVGYVRVAGFEASYYGRQRQTENNRGLTVYGGSDLVLVRGDFDALLAQCVPHHLRMVLGQARAWHAAAIAAYPGMFASRCNYDVARGVDELGKAHCGVLEQSWRVGGASGAELAGLLAFRDDPSLQRVHASTVEVYGCVPVLPEGARVYYAGEDERVGRLTKYAHVDVRIDTHFATMIEEDHDDPGHDHHA